ncbi:MAG: diguanylate cyclase domain-containing protein, partial [Limnospira sp.]
NPALVRWSGMAEADLLGKTVYDVYPPVLAAQYAADDARVLETGHILDTVEQHRVPHRDELIYVQVVKSPIRDGDGNIVGTQGIFWEVTERIQLENALKASEALLDLFFSQSLDGFFFMMLDEAIAWEQVDDVEAALDYVLTHQRMTRVNDALLAQYGATRDEFLGRTPADLFEHNPRHGRDVWKRLFDTGHLQIETDERKFDGTPMIVEGDYVCIYDDRGQIAGHFGIQRDITARKRAENDLREREEAFRALAENSPDCIMRCDRHYRFLYVNPTVASLAGLPDTAFWGKTSEELGFSADLVAVWHEAIDRVFAAGEEQSLEYEMSLPDGNHVFYSRIAPELGPDGEVASVLVVARDITDLKRAENALRQQVEQEHTLRLIAGRIRETLELDAILSAAVTEIQRSLAADRAIIFQLTSDRAGVVIQEAVSPEYPATATLCWEDECFPSECYDFYRRGRGRIVPDVARDDWGSCLVEFMGEIGVLSKMVAPIVQRGEDRATLVWGLIVIHACGERRRWKPEELALLEQVADQLAIAIQQSELYRRLHAANEELERLSNTDSLTQIANRRHFDERLKQEWRRIRRERMTLSLVLCDIDYFKQYNDTYGHPAGDACLVAVAQTLQRCINRETDCLARYGGEEFVVILPYTNLKGAVFIVEKMQSAIADLNREHKAHKSASHVTLSFGITATDFHNITPIKTLLDRADAALYQAKERGRNQYAIAPNSDEKLTVNN